MADLQQEFPGVPPPPGLSLVLIPTSCDLWHWHLYIRDPARKNQSVLFTRCMDLCILRFFTTRKLVTAGSYSTENSAGKSEGKSFLFSTMADGFCKNALISRFESCISDITSTNHAWVRSIFLHYLRLDSHYIGQLFVAPRTVTARGGHKSFTHIEHRAAAVGREGALNSSLHWVPGLVPTYLLP